MVCVERSIRGDGMDLVSGRFALDPAAASRGGWTGRRRVVRPGLARSDDEHFWARAGPGLVQFSCGSLPLRLAGSPARQARSSGVCAGANDIAAGLPYLCGPLLWAARSNRSESKSGRIYGSELRL